MAELKAVVMIAFDRWINNGRLSVGLPPAATPIRDTHFLRKRNGETAGLGLTDRLMLVRLQRLHIDTADALRAAGLGFPAHARPSSAMVGASKTHGDLLGRLIREYSI